MLLSGSVSRDSLERITSARFPELPSHLWLSTSGTGGSAKFVALSRNALAASAASVNRHVETDNHDVWLNPLPPFHVAGIAMLMRSQLSGARHEVLSGKWDAHRFADAAERVGATLSALVPTQVFDLVAAGIGAPECLRSVVVGGAGLAPGLWNKAAALGWPLLPSYGLTEAASQVATARIGHAFSDRLPLLGHIEARTDQQGVLELRGPSLLTGWMVFNDQGGARWEDPKHDGWYCTSDRVELHDRELRVLGRVDDLVKIRGELVDVVGLERALQERVASGEVMLRCVSDRRTGAALYVVAENDAAASEAKDAQKEVFPPFARPERITTGPIERTALGKKIRG